MKGKKSVIVDALIVRNGKIVHLPSDSARWAYVVALGAGKFETPIGVFRSGPQMKVAMGRYGRYVKELVSAGLVEVTEIGEYQIHDYMEWQSVSSTERVRRHREAQGASGSGPAAPAETVS